MAIKKRLETFKIDGKSVPVLHDTVLHDAQKVKSKWVNVKEVPIYRLEYINTGKKYPSRSDRQKERQRPLYRLCPLIKGKTCNCNNWKEVRDGNTQLCSIQTL